MSNFIINVTSGSDKGSLMPDAGFRYTDNLNEVNEADIKFSGTGVVRRELLVIGANVEIKRNNTREFYGFIDTIDYLEAGTVIAHVAGFEKWLALENGDYSNSPYTGEASATIATEIIAESNYLTAGTINVGFATDFRISKSDSLYNALSNLCRKTQQDIGIDYVNLEVDILDHKGSSSSVATYNSGLQIGNLRVTYAYPLGNHILVYGKGDGANQIKAESEDSGSITTYGRIKRVVIDRSIISIAEAQRLADAEKALTRYPTEIYDFEIINPNDSVVSGDHLLLNSQDRDLDNEEVRIVGIERGEIGGAEFLTVQVTNPAYKTLVRTRNKILAGLKKEQRDSNTYMEGTSNVLTYEAMQNGNDSISCNIFFSLPSLFITDEAGNIRVDSMTLDYDIDPFKKGYGAVSETNRDPDVLDTSAVNSVLSTVVEDGADNVGDTITTSWTTTDTWAISSHGQYICFNLNAFIADKSSTHDEVFSVYARVYDGSNYYPSSNGVRLWRGKIYMEEMIETEGHDHYTLGGAIWIYASGSSDGSNPYWSTVLRTSEGWDDVDFSEWTLQSGSGFIMIPDDPYGLTYQIQTRQSGNGNATIGLNNSYQVHSRHDHGPGDYYATSHNHAVSIGDGVSEAGSVNATSVSIHLDWYNPDTPEWELDKLVISPTNKTIDYDVDITDSGTYPDAAGLWRVRILTNNATGDLIQGIVKVKHNLDN